MNFVEVESRRRRLTQTYVKIDGATLLLRMSPPSPSFVLHQRKLLCVIVVIHLEALLS